MSTLRTLAFGLTFLGIVVPAMEEVRGEEPPVMAAVSIEVVEALPSDGFGRVLDTYAGVARIELVVVGGRKSWLGNVVFSDNHVITGNTFTPVGVPRFSILGALEAPEFLTGCIIDVNGASYLRS